MPRKSTIQKIHEEWKRRIAEKRKASARFTIKINGFIMDVTDFSKEQIQDLVMNHHRDN